MKAFPDFVRLQMLKQNDLTESQKETIYMQSSGMDLRDYFAIHANDYDIYSYMYETRAGSGISASSQIKTREEARYAYADAMMKAREQ